MKIIDLIKLILTFIGTSLGYFLGGFDALLVTLLLFMIIDYITGVLDAISNKKLSSSVGFKGICKKVIILLMVTIANRIDITLGLQEIRYVVISFYLANEGISIIENASLLGVPIPQKLEDILEQLKNEEKESQ